MKKLLLLIVIIIFPLFGFSQYPIKTIFRGDSVIVLSIEQSEKINGAIEKYSKNSKENAEKIRYQKNNIDSLKKIIAKQNLFLDSLCDIMDNNKNLNENLYDSLWTWSLGPSLIYTRYPDDTTIYIMDLSHYYMSIDDSDVLLFKMSEKDYKNYRDFIDKYGLDEKAFWFFRNEIVVKSLRGSQIKEMEEFWKNERRKSRKK